MDPNFQAFQRVLDPDDNATGGGTASAIAGAMAAALAGMVCRLSVGKTQEQDKEFYRSLQAQAQTLSLELYGGARQDAEAFDAVMAAVKLPKNTDREKSKRENEIQQAQIRATLVPLQNAGLCTQILKICVALHGRSNPNAASDLECARHLARAGLLGCLANVDINLPTLTNDELAAELSDQAQQLRAIASASGPDWE